MNPETLHNTMLTILTILTIVTVILRAESNPVYTSKDRKGSKDGMIKNIWNR